LEEKEFMAKPIWARTTYSSIDELKSLQLELLQKQLNKVYASSSFYHSKFEKAGIKPSDIKSLQDITKIPIGTIYKGLRRS
jgi:phenylacetate-CoA ligase